MTTEMKKIATNLRESELTAMADEAASIAECRDRLEVVIDGMDENTPIHDVLNARAEVAALKQRVKNFFADGYVTRIRLSTWAH